MTDTLSAIRNLLQASAQKFKGTGILVLFRFLFCDLPEFPLISLLKFIALDTGDEERNGQNRALFQGLKIMESGGGYTEQMGRYPVINLTLKSAKMLSFDILRQPVITANCR